MMKKLMQDVARAVERELPPQTGFFVLAFNFAELPGCQAQYVSNANRADIIKAMKEFLARNPMQEQASN